MKLDRNINHDGRGKYALINLRTNKVEWGEEGQFFVLKYKDIFAEAALRAYARAVRDEAKSLSATAYKSKGGPMFDSLRKQAKSLNEFASQIEDELKAIRKLSNRRIPD